MACTHCGAHGAKQELFVALDKLREMIGQPVHINSGYRCAKHPVEAAKTKPGFHAQGIAADIHVSGWSARQLYDAARRMPEFGGLGVSDYHRYLHVDLRKEPARWCYSRAGWPVKWKEAA